MPQINVPQISVPEITTQTFTTVPGKVLDNYKTYRNGWAIGMIIFVFLSSTVGIITSRNTNQKHLKQLSSELFRPAWEQSLWSLPLQEIESTLPAAINKIQYTIGDPDRRVHDDFNIPNTMGPRVQFWMLVQSTFGKRVKVIHDRNHPGIIYGYIDLTELYRTLGATRLFEQESIKTEEHVLQVIKKQIQMVSQPGSVNLVPNAFRSFIFDIRARYGLTLDELADNLRTQTGQRDEFLKALHRSKNLLPHISNVFRDRQLPEELGRIPFVESSFNPAALSKVGAMGVWQFMPATARAEIHPSDPNVWKDPLKQTVAAARLLHRWRATLPDWGTTLTSYNSGIGRIRRLLRTHELDGISKLILVQKNGLGFAGQNFYAQFLAATYLEAYKNDFFKLMIAPKKVGTIFKGNSPFPVQTCDLES